MATPNIPQVPLYALKELPELRKVGQSLVDSFKDIDKKIGKEIEKLQDQQLKAEIDLRKAEEKSDKVSAKKLQDTIRQLSTQIKTTRYTESKLLAKSIDPGRMLTGFERFIDRWFAKYERIRVAPAKAMGIEPPMIKAWYDRWWGKAVIKMGDVWTKFLGTKFMDAARDFWGKLKDHARQMFDEILGPLAKYVDLAMAGLKAGYAAIRNVGELIGIFRKGPSKPPEDRTADATEETVEKLDEIKDGLAGGWERKGAQETTEVKKEIIKSGKEGKKWWMSALLFLGGLASSLISIPMRIAGALGDWLLRRGLISAVPSILRKNQPAPGEKTEKTGKGGSKTAGAGGAGALATAGGKTAGEAAKKAPWYKRAATKGLRIAKGSPLGKAPVVGGLISGGLEYLESGSLARATGRGGATALGVLLGAPLGPWGMAIGGIAMDYFLGDKAADWAEETRDKIKDAKIGIEALDKLKDWFFDQERKTGYHRQKIDRGALDKRFEEKERGGLLGWFAGMISMISMGMLSREQAYDMLEKGSGAASAAINKASNMGKAVVEKTAKALGASEAHAGIIPPSSAGTTASRLNNPGNIKSQTNFGKKLIAAGRAKDSGVKALDGGTFLMFNSPGEGWGAMKEALATRSGDMSVDKRLRQWSGGGYGGELVPGLAGRSIASLSDSELNTLIQAMAKREGYKGAPLTAGELSRAPGEGAVARTGALENEAAAAIANMQAMNAANTANAVNNLAANTAGVLPPTAIGASSTPSGISGQYNPPVDITGGMTLNYILHRNTI